MFQSRQYVRLRNIGPDSTSGDTATRNGSAAHHHKPLPHSLRRPATATIVFLVSIVLNFFLLGKVLLSNTARDRILTYCKCCLTLHDSAMAD